MRTSRSSFLSGLRPLTTGVWNNSQVMGERLPPGAVTLPELLKKKGLHTAVIGKFFHQTDYARAQGVLALTIIDRAIELGRLPAAPARDGCRFCDFRPVCGPGEERRVANKPEALVADLVALRSVR